MAALAIAPWTCPDSRGLAGTSTRDDCDGTIPPFLSDRGVASIFPIGHRTCACEDQTISGEVFAGTPLVVVLFLLSATACLTTTCSAL